MLGLLSGLLGNTKLYIALGAMANLAYLKAENEKALKLSFEASKKKSV